MHGRLLMMAQGSSQEEACQRRSYKFAKVQSLKYFNEHDNDYHIVSAGSLLGVRMSKPKSFPVGKFPKLVSDDILRVSGCCWRTSLQDIP